MSSAPVYSTPIDGPSLPPLPFPGATPHQIRAALRPEHCDEFDRD
jgi:hypothetical protein